jgi:beta-glucosidase/6-phospho-beta-glucosidase/beta-galactosidase
MLREVQERYGRPIFIAETGIEDDVRPAWLHYVSKEVRGAARLGVGVEGICLYPIVNHPGWEDDRHCHNGLWDYADARGHREWYEPLAEEMRRQEALFSDEHAAAEADDERFDQTEWSVLDEAARHIDEETTRSRT